MTERSSDNSALELGRSLIDRLPTRQAKVARNLARRALGRTPPPPKLDLVVPDRSLVQIADPSAAYGHCPMCGTTAEQFLPYGVKATRPDRMCPGCRSLERHRLVWLFFGLHTDLLTAPSPGAGGSTAMLHIAPEPPMSNRLLQLAHIDYLSADLEEGQAMEVMDITDIRRPDATFDVIFASHVLEHIPNDVQAMSELRRVLKPDGWAVLEVPIFGAETREDPAVTDPAERERRFGQRDHVRMYGADGEYERRLRLAGFDVKIVPLADELGADAVRRFRLTAGDDVYLCRPAPEPR